jgi:hypothetical protein
MPTSALVVSVESVNGPISRYYAKYLSTERTWSGWLAGGPGFELRLTVSRKSARPGHFCKKSATMFALI